VITTTELEFDDIPLLRGNLLRVKPLMAQVAIGQTGGGAFVMRKLTRPIVPSLLAPTMTVISAAETREGARAAMTASTAVESFMVLNVE